MSEMSRTTSHKSHNTHTNDGHVDGNLNFTAFRHGWSRDFSIPAQVVTQLDYPVLEGVIELNTLKLSSTHTRIFVENPPDSDTWAKIRFWKDDGSLQSVLVQQFFTQRMQQGITTKIDIRDQRDRIPEDAVSIKSGIGLPGSLSRPGQTREWFKHNKLSRTISTRSRRDITREFNEESTAVPSTKLQAIKFILGMSPQAPPPPAKTEEELLQEQQAKEATMRKHGWMPPMLRRITSRKASNKTSGNPFFGGSSTSLARRSTRQADITEEGDGEELNLMEGEGPPVPNKAKQGKKWFNLFGEQAVSSPQVEKEDPFSDENSTEEASAAAGPSNGKKAKTKADKGKKKVALGGASVVRRPSDAFPANKKQVGEVAVEA